MFSSLSPSRYAPKSEDGKGDGMKIEIKYVEVDHPDLISLVDQLNDFFNQEWGPDVAKGYQNHHNLAAMACAVVAYQQDQPVGCGCWKRLADGRPEIKRMFVQPKARSGGVASRVLAALEEDILKQGDDRAVLETGAEMTSAISFYQKQGYQIIPNYGDFIGDDWCVCLEKQLK